MLIRFWELTESDRPPVHGSTGRTDRSGPVLITLKEEKAAADGKPSVGPVYRSCFAESGFPAPVPGLESCWDIFQMSVEKYSDNPMVGRRQNLNGKFVRLNCCVLTSGWRIRVANYKEVYDTVMKFGNSIRSCGVEKGGKCDIFGANCPEWVISMEACNAYGLYCVPLYDTLGSGALEFIICHAEVSIALLLKTFPKASEYLRTIVSFGTVTPEQKAEAEKHGLAIYPWEEFLKLGENKNFDLPVKTKSDICTIMYTSGTTGDPKGVLISNCSIATLIAGMKPLLESVNEELTEKDVYLSYLPLAHIFDRVIEEFFISRGAAIGFWRGDVKLLVEDIGELKPTIFCAVPRVIDRIHSGLLQKISGGSLLRRKLFNVAYSYKFGKMKKGSKERIGRECVVRLILSGAAPLSSHVEEFLRVVACCHVLQGYGLTETYAGTFVSLPNELLMFGTVGETLFSGYYKREDLTNEVLIDGWFHTGDIGEWQPNGSMKIIDRKNIFKLSQVEYVAVENLENIYGLSSVTDSIYGNGFESFLVAVVNPNKRALETWAAVNSVSGDFDSICQNPKARQYIFEELVTIAKEKKLKGFEFVKAVHLDPVPFDMERDLLTATYKKKRPQLLKHYQVCSCFSFVIFGLSVKTINVVWMLSVIDNMYKTANKPNA
ncbi:Long chain acyl-CoA synthetase 4 [Hibiscus syriacus]|uniref:Long chain acyl-CoA synthetase 4 n=1 Tax=Hibiscus syriacus TaxID=106335 RepID=A0A6A3AUB0_HIBSY|nr:Long chain acyl-CoA synthetase 4 [Hibiscus syriacus]